MCDNVYECVNKAISFFCLFAQHKIKYIKNIKNNNKTYIKLIKFHFIYLNPFPISDNTQH